MGTFSTNPARGREGSFALCALGLVGTGVVLRLLGWQNWSFWLDEAMTIDYISQGLRGLLRAVVADGNHPPLDYLVTWLWSRISMQEAWLRTLPVLWSVGTLLALIARAGGRGTPVRALATAATFATFPLAIYLGQEVRPYAAALCLVAAFDAARASYQATGSLRARRWAVRRQLDLRVGDN